MCVELNAPVVLPDNNYTFDKIRYAHIYVFIALIKVLFWILKRFFLNMYDGRYRIEQLAGNCMNENSSYLLFSLACICRNFYFYISWNGNWSNNAVTFRELTGLRLKMNWLKAFFFYQIHFFYFWGRRVSLRVRLLHFCFLPVRSSLLPRLPLDNTFCFRVRLGKNRTAGALGFSVIFSLVSDCSHTCKFNLYWAGEQRESWLCHWAAKRDKGQPRCWLNYVNFWSPFVKSKEFRFPYLTRTCDYWLSKNKAWFCWEAK